MESRAPGGRRPTERAHSADPRDRRTAWLLFSLLAVLYYVAPIEQLYDYRFIGAVSDALITRGTFSLPEALEGERTLPYQLGRVAGRVYHHFPHAPAVLNTPFALAFRIAGRPVLGPEGYSRDNEIAMLRVSAALTTAAAAAVGFLLARLFTPWAWSLAIAVVFGLGTSLASIASRPYWSHSWGVLLLTLALWLGLAPTSRRRTRWALVATALSWAVFCRPVFALSVVAIGLWLLLRRRPRDLAVFVASGLAWLALFVVYSHSLFAQALPPYFFSEQVASGRWRPSRFFDLPAVAAWGTLASPGRGLFVFTPFLVAIPPLLAWHWKRLPDRALAALGLAAIAGNWLLVSSFRNWWGGAGFGPRLLSDSLPWWLLLAALAVAARQAAPLRHPRFRFLAGAALALLAVASIAIHQRGAWSRETREWGAVRWAPHVFERAIFHRERLWKWSYPQFLAGLVPEPFPHFDSAACGDLEQVEVLSCGPPFRIRVAGPPHNGFGLRVNTGRARRGRLDAAGQGEIRIPRKAYPFGWITASWVCGSVRTIAYDCAAVEAAAQEADDAASGRAPRTAL